MPDRLIVGEVRGEEAADLLTAMNTGHSGSLSTGHSNSAKDMLSRLETMVLMGMDLPLSAIRRQIASGIDLLVHLGRMRDRSRKLLEITEIIGFRDGEICLSPLFVFEETEGQKKESVEGCWKKVGELAHTEKLEAAGLDFITKQFAEEEKKKQDCNAEKISLIKRAGLKKLGKLEEESKV